MPQRWCIFFVVLFVAATSARSNALAQVTILNALKSEEKAKDEVPDVEAKREDAAEKLRVAQRDLDTVRAASPAGAAPAEEQAQEVDLRDQVERVLAQQQDAERRKKELAATLAELQRKLDELRANGGDEPPSRSFLLLDETRDQLDSELKREESVRATVKSAEVALERAKSSADEKERRRLKAKDAAATNKDQAQAAPHAKALAAAELERDLASELVNLRRMELEIEKQAEQVYRVNTEFLKEQAAWLAKIARLDEQDLHAQIESLEKQAAKLKRRLVLAEPDAEFLEDRWFDARRRAEAATEKSPELAQEVEARRLAYMAQQQRIAVYNAQIRRLAEMRTAWNRRFKVASQTDEKLDLAKWIEETEQAIEQLKSEALVQTQKSDEIRKKLAVFAGKAPEERAEQSELAQWLEGQRESLQKLSQSYETNHVGIEASLRLHEKLLTEMRGDTAPTLGSRVASLWQWAADAWNYPVSTYDDRPITVGKIVIGLVLFILGYFASRIMSRIFGRRMLRRMGVHESASAAIQTVTFYLLLIFFALFALHVANVPLTALTLLGGAAALGIGFGSQNIVNNFISGLILLAERPIRIGDLIQIDGLFAVVERIGARSTWLKTGSNVEIIVPNSKFLENNVTNWTLSDARVRCDIQVGVAYGSPTKQASDLLIRSAKLQEMVMVDPEPFVLFKDFGDNSLVFQLSFWIQMTSLAPRLTIESQVRFTIDDLFREADIVIAYPQRDIHLNTMRPLDIRLLPSGDDMPKWSESAA